jgi:hypothetical protein
MDAAEPPALFSKKGLCSALMDWAMRDEHFKTQLFRFVDVLPTLTSAGELARHLKEYLGDEQLKLSAALRLGLKAAGGASWLFGSGVKAQVTGMARQFMLGNDEKEIAATLLWSRSCKEAGAGIPLTAISCPNTIAMGYSPRARWTGLVMIAALGLAPRLAQAQGRQFMQGHVPEGVSRLTPIGRLPADAELYLTIGVPLRDPAGLDQFLAQLYDPGSTNFHKFLTTAEFTARFGPTEQDYEAVKQFAANNGLVVAATYPNLLVLDVAGNATRIETAFQVTLRLYRHPTEPRDFFAPDAEPSVPPELKVLSVEGLSDFSLPRRADVKVSAANRRSLSFNGTGPYQEYAGNDFRNAYVPGTPLKGTNQTVALLEYSDYYKVDVTNYEDFVGASVGATNYVPLNNVLVGGSTPGTSANGEVALDIEMAIAMAPMLSRVMVYEKKSVSSSLLNQIATDNLAKQVSSSWMVGPWSSSTATTYDNILKNMAAQGQSYFQSSGDGDAYTGTNPLDSGTTVPADSPYATIVGGTTLTMNGSGASWNSETVWNYNLTGIPNKGSGGGISAYYARPWWQTNLSMAGNGGSTANRNIPDVALTADDIYVCYNNGDTSGTNYFMGTSAAAPLWAGFCALANQLSMATNGTTLGFMNPTLYNIAVSSCYLNSFHDITVGNNIGTNAAGMFYAVAGYDLATGIGTPNGTNLINALVWPPPMFTNQPAGTSVTNGSSSVTFTATAISTTPMGYFWLFDGTNLMADGNVSGVTTNTLSIAAATTNNAGNYQLVASNFTAFVTSSVAVLNVGFAPGIVTQPTNLTVLVGSNADFAAAAAGSAPLAYQWRTNGVKLVNGGNISGATSNVLTLTAVTTNNAGNYTLLVTNLYGSATSSVATLTVVLPPKITLPPTNQTTQCGSNAAFSVTATGTTPLEYQWSLDGAAVTGATTTSLSLTNIHLPNHTVAVVVTNLYGSASSSVTLTVQDTLPPVITLNGPNPLTSQCHALFVDPGATATDTCAGNLGVTTNSTVNPNAVGTYAIRYTATDPSGNAATNTRTVYIVDTTPPVVTLNGANPLTNQCHALFVDPGATATDTCAGSLGVTTNSTVNPNAVGTYTIGYTATDPSGNAATNTRTVYIVDTTPPVITWFTNVLVGADTNCQALMPDITVTNYILAVDNCSSVTVTQSVTTNTVLSLGTNEVVLGAFDAAGNVAYCTNYVLVVDQTPPSITCPPDVHVTTDPGQCDAVVYYTAPVGQDTCSGAVTVQVGGLASGAFFPLGKTTNTFQATDGAGNSAACSFVVTVNNAEPPVITWFTNAMVGADTNCQAVMPDVTGTNYILAMVNCGSVTVTQSVATNTVLGLGTNEVVLGAFDAAGNVAYCTNYVLVVDQTPPSITCPADVHVANDPGQCGAVVQYAAPVSQDNCSGAVTVQAGGLASGALFPLGRTTNSFQVTDGAGNGAACSFVVTVDDLEPPVITWFTNIVVGADTNCQAVMPDVTGTNYILAVDNCSSVTVTQSVATNTVLSLGTNEVVLGAFDAAGNVAYCTNYVLVVDQTPPTMTCPTNLVVTADAGQCSKSNVTWTVTASAKCGVATVVSEPQSGSTFVVGTTTVATRATDSSGNTSICTFTVTVLDTEPPAIICPANMTVSASDPTGAVVNYLVLATDNCDPNPAIVNNPPSGSLFPLGTNTVTCTATDASGNTNSCTFTVTVSYCPKLSITLVTTNGVAQVQVCWPNAGSSCALQSTADLTPPAQWQAVDLPVVPMPDGSNCVTITNLTDALFYRLCGGGP